MKPEAGAAPRRAPLAAPEETVEGGTAAAEVHVLDLVRDPKLRRHTIIMSILWSVLTSNLRRRDCQKFGLLLVVGVLFLWNRVGQLHATQGRTQPKF